MKVNYSSQKADVRIELLPLIDVVFCILTFFMLAAVTLTRQSGINVDLPTAASGVSQMQEMLLVSVDPVGLIYVEKDPVTEQDLRQRLIEFQAAQPNGTIVLYASRLSSYNDVVRVLDILRAVGGDRVALATLPSTSDDASNAPFSFPSDPSGLPSPDGLTDPDAQPFPGFEDPLLPPAGSSGSPGSSGFGSPDN